MNDRTKKIVKVLIYTCIGVVLNVAGRVLTDHVSVPLWLDSVGTLIAVYMGGPVAGIIAAAFSVIYGLFNTNAIIYVIVSLIIAGGYIIITYMGAMERFYYALLSTLPIAIVAAIVSTPINMLVYGGKCGNAWGDALTEMLIWRGAPDVFCSFCGEMAMDLLDKQVCVVLGWLIIQLLKKKFEPMKVVKKAAVLGLAILVVIAPVASLSSEKVYADEDDNISVVERSTAYTSNYTSVVYDNANGIMSAEANTIAETSDGVLWFGSYAGLTRYDGVSFEFISNPLFATVTTLYVDSRDVLWIGTSDSGIVSYENGTCYAYTKDHGLSSNSIRSIVENTETGDIYCGTSDKLCRITREGRIFELNDVDLTSAISLVEKDGVIFAACFDGSIHAIEDDEEIACGSSDMAIYSVGLNNGNVVAGGVGKNIYSVGVNDEEIILKKKYEVEIEGINYISEDESRKLWICADNGLGYIAENKEFYPINIDGFDNQIKWVHQDYQGNIWLASARRGIAKLCENQFENIFNTNGIEKTSVNAVIEYNDKKFCATDYGLEIIGDYISDSEKKLIDDLTDIRIRALYVDSHNNLWLATYGDKGLVKYDAKTHSRTYFTEESCKMSSNNVRCIIELKDGTIAAGTSDGLNFIKKNALVGKLTAADGLANTQILNLSVGYDGTLFVGTDGAGLYTVKDMVIDKCYDTDTGLSSDVVMRTTPYERGLFIIVTNGLYYMEDDQISRIEKFPYFNNFDMIIDEDKAYIISSAGVFVLDIDDLINNNLSAYDLFGTADGLTAGLVSNSWSCLGSDGKFYLCTNVGVMSFNRQTKDAEKWYKFGIDKILGDGEEITFDGEKYIAPKGVKNIVISPSVRSYELGDVMVRFYVEGLEEQTELVSFKELSEKSFNWVNSGQYVIHLQLYSRDSKTLLQERSYILTKDRELWETTTYIVYLCAIIADLLVMLSLIVISFANRRHAERERAALRKANEIELTRQIEKAKSDLKKNEKENQIKLKRQLEQTISALAKTVDAKDAYTNGHSSRVAKYAMEIARRYGHGWESEENQDIIGQAGLLHDVGKIKIPDAIINKPGKLTDAEYDTIKTHSEWGYSILSEIEALPDLARAARYHHERFDGKGYPIGLKEDQIPIMARIIAVADSYDAMTSNRSYRRLLPQAVVRAEIEKGKGSQFDPVFADIMIRMIDDDKEYRMNEDRDKEDGINYEETWKKD